MTIWKDYEISEATLNAIASGMPRIRALREGEHVSSRALAFATDISIERMQQLERGALPTERELTDISNALAVPLNMLVAPPAG